MKSILRFSLIVLLAALGSVLSAADSATLDVMARNAQLMEIKQRSLAEIFGLWRDAGRVDEDLMKQGAIATTLAYAMREKSPGPELVEEMRRFVADKSNSFRERAAVIGIFGGAKTKIAVDFLLQTALTLDDEELRRVAVAQINGVGALWGDGSYHEERSPALEAAWHDSRDPELLIAVATAMAKIGAPRAIDGLLHDALAENDKDAMRKRTALDALDEIYTSNAVPSVAAHLASQPSASSDSVIVGNILVGIGDASAAKALLDWLRAADAGAAPAAGEFVARTRTPRLLAAWKEAVDSKTTFRSEEVREGIRRALTEYTQNHNSSR